MDRIPQWKPTVAISHAEGCVTNAIISQELAQKIFRLVTDDINGIEEGPKIESLEKFSVDHKKLGSIIWRAEAEVKTGRDPAPIVLTLQAEFGLGMELGAGPLYTMVFNIWAKHHGKPPIYAPEAASKPRDPEKIDTRKEWGELKIFCAVKDCPEPAEEGHGVCEFHGGGEPKGIPNDPKEDSKPLCACGCGKPVTKRRNKFLHGHGRHKSKKAEEAKIYDDLKTSPKEPHDLMIINGEVMCPRAKGAITCEGIDCNKYIATIRTEEDGEPHIRCAEA